MIIDSIFRNAPERASRTIASDGDFALKRSGLGRNSAEGARDALPLAAIGQVLRLRGQCRSIDRLAVHQQLMHRVACQARRIVPIRVSAGNRIQPLAENLVNGMVHLARLAPIFDAPGQGFAQSQPFVGGLQQDRSTIRAPQTLVKLHPQRALQNIVEQNTLSCDSLGHTKAFDVVEMLVAKPFYRIEGFCFSEFRRVHE